MEILLDIIRSVDYNILLLIADRLRGGVLDPVMTMLSLIGNGGAVWITLAVLLLFFRKTRRAGAAMLLAMLAGFIVGNLWLKELVMRPRPFVTHSDLTALLAPGDRWSFPSGHALSSFAAATALWCFHKKTGVLALVLAALIAFSRLYASVHYPFRCSVANDRGPAVSSPVNLPNPAQNRPRLEGSGRPPPAGVRERD